MWPAVGVVLLALGTATLLPSARPRQASLAHRYSSLDGLRGYLALAVFLSHSSIWYFYLHSGVWDVPPSTLYTQLGQSSVTLFFMITGLLFWSKLLNGRLEPIDWTRLYLSRVLRLGPLYLVAAACVILVAFCRAGFELKEPPWVVVGQVATWLMFTIPGISPVNGFAETVPIAGAVWTLSYEWLFYACLPIGAFCLRASTPLPWLVFSAGAVTALTMGMPEVRMPMLSAFAGGITAASLSRIPAVRAMLARGVWGAIAMACLATTLFLLPTAYMWSAVVLLAIAFLIIASGNSLYGMLEWRASVTLGEMAYSLYLLHGLVLFVAYRLVFAEGADGFSPVEHWAIVLGLVPESCCFCVSTCRLIEKPAMDAVPRWHAWLTARFS
ncbi:MAG: acyltransferase [Nitrospira sp.]|nr:acyltransferase [Nitrospira sp.]